LRRFASTLAKLIRGHRSKKSPFQSGFTSETAPCAALIAPYASALIPNLSMLDAFAAREAENDGALSKRGVARPGHDESLIRRNFRGVTRQD
jgi:hypothetical protein